MDERELRASLKAIGALLPVVTYMGSTIDGEKRERLCAELGISITRRACVSLHEACSTLWTQHPDRAIELARRYGGDVRLAELAELCGAKPAHLSRALQAMRPPRKRVQKAPRRLISQKNVIIHVWMEPQLRHFIQLAAQREGVTVAAFVRQAVWQRAKIIGIREPRAGSKLEPQWVKPKERKVLGKR